MINLKFDWDKQNASHLARHQISPSEAEQVILNRPLEIGTELRNREERIAHLGETDLGRVLMIVSTTLADGKIRIVTAWPAKERLRRYFKSHKESGNAGRIEEKNIRE